MRDFLSLKLKKKQWKSLNFTFNILNWEYFFLGFVKIDIDFSQVASPEIRFSFCGSSEM